MKFINKVSGKPENVPTLMNWAWTLDGIEILLKNLENKHKISSVWMRHLNQDPIEIFFGAIRSHGCRNTNPTPQQFGSAFSTMRINNLSSVHAPVGSNCEEDFGKNLHALVVTDDCEALTNCSIELIHNIVIENIKSKSDPRIMGALQYVCGYFIRKVKIKVFKNCTMCKNNTISLEGAEYIKYRKYAGRSSLYFTMEDGFVKAESTNLPMINSLMVGKFFASNPDFCSAELRNVKTTMSGRESYGDDAIGYVQLKRVQNTCVVKCTVCPEHKVRIKPYAVTLVVNEQEETVTSVKCHDCPSSEGGCKHSVAFLMWLHRRTETPSCTSVECYWRKSNLAKVGSSIKILCAKEISKRKPKEMVQDSSVLNEFLLECNKKNIDKCQFLRHEPDFDSGATLSLHHLIMKYNDENCDIFLTKISHLFNQKTISSLESRTRDQHKSGLWHELRYGRITASKCYEVSQCKTVDGALVAMIFGAKVPETPAISRGKKLEDEVRIAVEKKMGIKIAKCGLYISEAFPMVAGSPDGINNKTTFEIKCPSSEKTTQNDIDKNGTISKKYFAQVQMQMYCAKGNKSYFCVASSDFKKNNQVTIIPVEYEHEYVMKLLNSVVAFWKNNIFPILYKSVKV